MPFFAVNWPCHAQRKTELRVSVVDDEIIVTWPGSIYYVTYCKPENSPQLLAKRIADHDDTISDDRG